MFLMAVCGTPGTGKTRILNAFRDDDFVFTVTMSEAIKDATEVAYGEAIHL